MVMRDLRRNALPVLAFATGITWLGAACADTMVPAQSGACPSGSHYAGSGYCRASGRVFVPAHQGACPSGASYAGAGYCGAPEGTGYVPSQRGACPSGSSYAGAGYCKLR